MENGRDQTETDGDGRRMFENKFYVTEATDAVNWDSKIQKTQRLKRSSSAFKVLFVIENCHQSETIQSVVSNIQSP